MRWAWWHRWGRSKRWRRWRHDQRGSISIETAIVFGVVMVTFFSLMIGAGRVLSAENKVRSAAHAAARAASLEGSYGDAVAAAETIAGDNLVQAGVLCQDRSIVVTSSAAEFVPGGWVQVEVSCTPRVLPFGLAENAYVYEATEVIDEFRTEP